MEGGRLCKDLDVVGLIGLGGGGLVVSTPPWPPSSGDNVVQSFCCCRIDWVGGGGLGCWRTPLASFDRDCCRRQPVIYIARFMKCLLNEQQKNAALSPPPLTGGARGVNHHNTTNHKQKSRIGLSEIFQVQKNPPSGGFVFVLSSCHGKIPKAI